MHSRARGLDSQAAWNVVRAAARHAEQLDAAGRPGTFALDGEDDLRRVDEHDDDAVIAWAPGVGWRTVLPSDDPGCALIDLYLPICSATAARPITVGHLGQSLDGFIATHAGESRWVTGEENLLHMHRLRALCDAVVVGAGTVAADDPQLTTRRVPGSNPLRIVLDPTRRLNERYRVFSDEAAETWYVCARSSAPADNVTFGRAEVIVVDDAPEGGVDVEALMRLLRQRGCTRVFVEGGGVTVSMFLAANLLDRLHMTIAPLIIGNGRPAIRLAPRSALGDCHRPRYRVFRMGGDMLFDCDVRHMDEQETDTTTDLQPPIVRVI